ncbi:MAG: fimbrial protein [Alistipes sp.]|nr:fimbrial protein [Alistipes sp.]
MKKVILLSLLPGIVIFNSCIGDENPVRPQTDEASILVAVGTSTAGTTRGTDPGDAEDSAIKELRIIVFKSNGTLVLNEHIDDINASTPHKLELYQDTYDFVFIGNEDSDPTLTAKLEALSQSATLSSLESITFSYQSFTSDRNIPMSRIHRQVEILGSNRYIVDGQERTDVWTVSMSRLGVRMDLTITTDSYIKQRDFAGLEITNVPVSVPILETTVSGNKILNGGSGNYLSTPIAFDVSDGEDGTFKETTDASGNTLYQWKLDRVILPSNVFSPDNEENAMTLTCIYDGGETASGVIETGMDGFYQIPRNTYLRASMAIAPSLEIYLDAENWDTVLLEKSIGATRTLNVSAFTATISDRTRTRIWFSSNMPEIYVDELTAGGEYVDDIFYDLAGPGASNLHYDYDQESGEGTGYLDLMTDYTKLTPNRSHNHKIYLSAAGLKREITITSNVGNTQIGYFEYVGAFWRNDQTGERLISGRNDGTWRAVIEYGAEWFVIAPGKSVDENVWTDNPGDAEDYPVEGNATELSGSGFVFFRVGCKSANTGNTPRYGRIMITTSNTPSPAYIYLRQGEDPDYLMRPEDYGVDTSGELYEIGPSGSAVPRPSAVKFSVFNITARDFYNGTNSGSSTASQHPSVGDRQGVEVDYPSQAGAFFQWGHTTSPRAYHPSNAVGALTGFTNNISSEVWDKLGYDNCPEGYRRPASVRTDRTASYNNQLSELAQSLWVHPSGVVSQSQTANALFGYYADGFFDRRPVEDPMSYFPNLKNTLSAVRPTETNVGYSGCLFFNPNTDSNASIFFPCPGERDHSNTGAVRYTGAHGYYWSSGATSNATAHSIYIQSPQESGTSGNLQYISRNGVTLNVSNANRSKGANIRCVKEE